MTEISGQIYTETGALIVSGCLYITPYDFIPVGSNIVIPKTVTIDIPSSGDLLFTLVPTGDLQVKVEYDPNPDDTTTPLQLKVGYFTEDWTIPSTGSVDITAL